MHRHKWWIREAHGLRYVREADPLTRWAILQVMDDRDRVIDEARRALRSVMNTPQLSVAALERWERADDRRQELGISDEELGTEAIYARVTWVERVQGTARVVPEATSGEPGQTPTTTRSDDA